MDNAKRIDALVREARRIEEDALHSAKGHFNAASMWRFWRWVIGIPAVVLATWASFQAVSQYQLFAAFLAMGAAALSAVATLLDPERRASEHEASGREFNALKNSARKFREIEVFSLAPESAEIKLDEIFKRRDDLNRLSPDIPRRCYKKAVKDIDEGRATYQADIENENS